MGSGALDSKWSGLLSLPALLSSFESDCLEVGVRGLLQVKGFNEVF